MLGAACALDLAGVDPNTLSCDPLGQQFLLLPHFTDCNKFYMCANGREVEFTCSGGTIFDFVEQTCNWDWATKCWLRGQEESSAENGSDEFVEPGEGSGEGSGGVEEWSNDVLSFAKPSDPFAPVKANDVPASHFAAKLDCGNARDAARMVPFVGDCQRYWRCVDGLPVSSFCSDGLFFNESKQQCDFEGNVKCSVSHDEELQGEFMVFK
ncbi:chitin binding peritrophin-A domain-containing protein [Phthorimaea operculella]|nr:chitin binding peritrophin-A domain-containing protein [Phthorimaea operculella]